ncbi:MAG: GNAT family N-acetyltransferase [Candidatus Hodarchaeota archaeon]
MFSSRTVQISKDPLVTLQKATTSDLEFIKEVSHSEMDSIVPTIWNWKSWFDDLERDLLSTPPKVFHINFQSIQIGYLWLNEEENSLWITAIVLKSEYQRHRIGQNILEFLIEQSQKKGKNYIELGVQRNNHAALQFYSKLGFEQFDFFKSVNTALLRLRLKSL